MAAAERQSFLLGLRASEGTFAAAAWYAGYFGRGFTGSVFPVLLPLPSYSFIFRGDVETKTLTLSSLLLLTRPNVQRRSTRFENVKLPHLYECLRVRKGASLLLGFRIVNFKVHIPSPVFARTSCQVSLSLFLKRYSYQELVRKSLSSFLKPLFSQTALKTN